jgi:hypothetical protein
MASKLRVEFVRLRDADSNGIQNIMSVLPGVAPVTKAVNGTALTGAGRVTCPANVGGYTKFHARLCSDVECIVTVAPAGNDDTAYDASATEPGGIWVPADVPVLIPVEGGQLLSAATGLAFA